MGEFKSPSEKQIQKAAPAKKSQETSSASEADFLDSRSSTFQLKKFQEAAQDSGRGSGVSSLQTKSSNHSGTSRVAQLQGLSDNRIASEQSALIQKKENKTGIPDGLKSGMESVSGISLNDVTVHRNSDKPAQLQAHAYAQGTDVHLAPGQEKHLPHELGHVVQQKQGRVAPTTQLKAATLINDDKGLEQEADVMGAKAVQAGSQNQTPLQAKSWGSTSTPLNPTIQRVGEEPKKLNIGTGKIQGWGTSIKNLFGKTTFTKLTEEVEKFNSLKAEKQGEQGKIVKSLCQNWLDSHKDSTDPNDLEKKNAIEQIMIDLKGDSVEKAIEKNILSDEEQAKDLGITDGKIEQKQKEVADKGFVDESGKITDKKGKLFDTSFMSDAESTMQTIVEKADQNLGTINKNEKTIRSDAAMHTFFKDEKEKAKTEEERLGVTKHAESVYNSGFIKNILTWNVFTSKGGKDEVKKELDTNKLGPYKNESFNSAKKISSMNNEADDDLATLVAFAQHIQTLSKNEKAKPVDEEEESLQTDRKEVLEYLKDSAAYDVKIEAEKEKSDALIQPLKNDGRLAGWFRSKADALQTVAASQVAQVLTMGFVSAKPKFMTGGLASNEGFDLIKDEATGEFTGGAKNEFKEGGKEGDSRYDFNGPKSIINGVVKNMDKVTAQAAKFPNKSAIKGFFIFSGSLKEFESVIGYIKQIVGAIQKWATGLAIIAPPAGLIVAACTVINQIIDLITQSSKAARLLFNSLVKIMNNDPALWGLVSQNFKASAVDVASIAASEGIESGVAAGQAAALGEDAGAAVQDRFADKVNTDIDGIAAKSALESAEKKSTEESAIDGGATATTAAASVGESAASDALVGDNLKKITKKKGIARPRVATKAFESTVGTAIPVGKLVTANAEDLVGETEKKELSNSQEVISAIDAETTKLNTEDATQEVVSEKQKEATDKKEEASMVPEVSSGIKEIGENIVESGFVATQVALINKQIKEAQEKEALRASQPGGRSKKR